MKKLAFIFLLSLQYACTPAIEMCGQFDLNKPKEFIKLPIQLKEISGITLFTKNKIACVQDEKGIIYIYDIKKDKLKESIEFGKNKDYEAIANVNDTIYVLSSNGNIYEIDSLESDRMDVIIHETFLSKVNNSEGMCYDSRLNRLLIACKGRPEKGSAGKNKKAVYAFDLNTKTMSETPVLILDPEELIAVANSTVHSTSRFFGETKGEDQFDPSEIAIEPETGNYFILSSVGKRLAVFSNNGKLLCVVNLDPEIYKQPEGIVFSTNGDLIISDEGKTGKGNLVIVGKIN